MVVIAPHIPGGAAKARRTIRRHGSVDAAWKAAYRGKMPRDAFRAAVKFI